MANTSAFYQAVMSHFPKKGMRMAFAYGSGVFQQVGHKNMKKNMVDFIFAVDNPVHWHKENITRNKKHYSFLKHFGAEYVSWIQNDFGARIYFNTLVPCESRIIKYGVISTQSLINDLKQWETLYVSGRLHKPVFHIIEDYGQALNSAIQDNYKSAASIALLMLPDTFPEVDYYYTIAGLSYSGDFRMTFGEDKNKVWNIVKPNVERFQDIYGKYLGGEFINCDNGTVEQSLCIESRYQLLDQLPLNMQYLLTEQRNMDGRHRDTEEVMRGAAADLGYHSMIRKAIQTIVKRSSRSQSIKGIATAGFRKSIKYSSQKLIKMYKSQK